MTLGNIPAIRIFKGKNTWLLLAVIFGIQFQKVGFFLNVGMFSHSLIKDYSESLSQLNSSNLIGKKNPLIPQFFKYYSMSIRCLGVGWFKQTNFLQCICW